MFLLVLLFFFWDVYIIYTTLCNQHVVTLKSVCVAYSACVYVSYCTFVWQCFCVAAVWMELTKLSFIIHYVNYSSNFIQPVELLAFTRRLKTNCPPHRLTLDLRKNPGDRDPDTWNAALEKLRPFCVVVVEGWKSTDTMVDHVSNMWPKLNTARHKQTV